jgi:DNA-binding response OmpR family regulator
MGGRLAMEGGQWSGLSLVAELPFAIDQALLARPPDLAGLPVLIVSKDAELVDDLLTPLEAWHADAHWIGADDDALRYLAAFDQGTKRALLIVDGRGDVLQILGWAHRAAALRVATPPHTLFIADELHIDSIVGLADGELDVILPAPLNADVLRGALHSLMVEPVDGFLAGSLQPPTEPAVRAVPAEVEEEPPDELIDLSPEPLTSAQPVSPREQPANRRPQVMIATGNASNRRIIGSLLSRSGYAVHFAASADEARKALGAREIDVLLLDLTGAPGADYEAARLCRRARPGLTIIALSNDDAVEAERRARQVGLDAVLQKPLSPPRLKQAIEAAVEGRTVPSVVETAVANLSSHPRFAPEASASRPAGVKPLRQTTAFFRGVIDTFRSDSGRIIADLGQAAGAGDTEAFEAGLQALRKSTANFGASRLRELLQAMRGQTPEVLRRQGPHYVQRLDAELKRLDAVLVERLRTAN